MASFTDLLLPAPDVDHVENPRALIRAGLLGTLLLFAALAAWIAVAPLSGAVIAPAVVKVDMNRKTVQHQEGGIVGEILVRDGDKVKAGQPLLILKDVRVDASYDLVQTQLDAEMAKAARLAAEQVWAKDISFPDELRRRASDPRVADLLRKERALFVTRARRIRGAGRLDSQPGQGDRGRDPHPRPAAPGGPRCDPPAARGAGGQPGAARSGLREQDAAAHAAAQSGRAGGQDGREPGGAVAGPAEGGRSQAPCGDAAQHVHAGRRQRAAPDHGAGVRSTRPAAPDAGRAGAAAHPRTDRGRSGGPEGHERRRGDRAARSDSRHRAGESRSHHRGAGAAARHQLRQDQRRRRGAADLVPRAHHADGEGQGDLRVRRPSERTRRRRNRTTSRTSASRRSRCARRAT